MNPFHDSHAPSRSFRLRPAVLGVIATTALVISCRGQDHPPGVPCFPTEGGTLALAPDAGDAGLDATVGCVGPSGVNGGVFVPPGGGPTGTGGDVSGIAGSTGVGGSGGDLGAGGNPFGTGGSFLGAGGTTSGAGGTVGAGGDLGLGLGNVPGTGVPGIGGIGP